jgi:hypothetical protein
MKTLMMLSALAIAGLVGGCVVHDDRPYHHHTYGPAVVVETGHVHSESCGHYHHDGRWYHSANHRHGPGCGHVYRGGMWIVVN